MPKFSVIRLEKSNETSNCEAGGTSAVLDQATVGSDISSATQGSSVASVAGRKRAPTKQWARALVVDSAAVRLASASAYSKCRDIGISPVRICERKSSQPKEAALHHTLVGGPLGRATEYCEARDKRSRGPA